jgi:two-component system alkaline phosphatase synthesis response regulator PhoP
VVKILIDSLEIDTNRRAVRLAGRVIAMAPKEYELLALLATNRGRVFARHVLLEKVWGYTFAGETRTVDVHVRALREKLGDDASNPRYIETVRRVGYRFRLHADGAR